MKAPQTFGGGILAAALLLPLAPLPLSAAPIAGVDFSDTAVFNDTGGGNDLTPDDLDPSDSITVSDWSFANGGRFEDPDGNSNANRPSPPVRKMNGAGNNNIKPNVGDPPPTVNEHSFSITIPAGVTVDLTNVKFNFSTATGGDGPRWLAFRTSLDTGIIWSEFGIKRPDFPAVDIVLSDSKYEGLTAGTVTFYWYAGKETDTGDSGDIDIDTIIIEGDVTSADVDMDNLPDAWEQQIVEANPGDGIDTVFDVLPGDDFDMDDSDNQEEFDRETDPTDPDSDDDDLFDGHESDDRMFDSATDTGSDPLEPDTDGDTISDGDEVNGVGGFVTDPNEKDTDGDLFPDDVELLLGSDPTLIDDVPSVGTKILFIGDDPTAAAGADAEVLTFLQDRYGTENVVYQQASATPAGDELLFGVLMISSTIGSEDGRDKFHNSPVPVVNWEEALMDNGGGEFGLADSINKSTDMTQLNLAAHPITEGLPATIDFVSGGETLGTGNLVAGLPSIATANDGSIAGENSVLIADVGDPLDPGANVTNDTAPARRVMFPMTDGTFNSLTDDGKTLFGQAIDWALGISGTEEPLRITEITLTRTSAPDNIIVDLTFTSEEGKTYTLYRSADFDLEVTARADVRDDIAGAVGADSTDFSIDYNAEGIPLDTPAQFFVVRENPPAPQP